MNAARFDEPRHNNSTHANGRDGKLYDKLRSMAQSYNIKVSGASNGWAGSGLRGGSERAPSNQVIANNR